MIVADVWAPRGYAAASARSAMQAASANRRRRRVTITRIQEAHAFSDSSTRGLCKYHPEPSSDCNRKGRQVLLAFEDARVQR